MGKNRNSSPARAILGAVPGFSASTAGRSHPNSAYVRAEALQLHSSLGIALLRKRNQPGPAELTIDANNRPKNPPNEFPDIVGAKPDNPFLASFRPYVPASVRMRELTPLPLIIGTLLGMVFGASSLYLVLKVG